MDLWFMTNVTLPSSRREGAVFSLSNAVPVGYLHRKRKETWSLPHIICNLNFKGIVDLSVNDKTVKLLESNIREYLHHPGVAERSFDMTQKVLAVKKMDKTDDVKIRHSFLSKDVNEKIKRDLLEWEETCHTHISYTGLTCFLSKHKYISRQEYSSGW